MIIARVPGPWAIDHETGDERRAGGVNLDGARVFSARSLSRAARSGAARDLAALATVSGLMWLDFLPAAWPIPVGSLLLAALAACFPAISLPLANVAFPAAAISLLFAWNRVIRSKQNQSINLRRKVTARR